MLVKPHQHQPHVWSMPSFYTPLSFLNWAGVRSGVLISLNLTWSSVLETSVSFSRWGQWSCSCGPLADDASFAGGLGILTPWWLWSPHSILSMIIFASFFISHIISITNASIPKMANSMMPHMADAQKLNWCSWMAAVGWVLMRTMGSTNQVPSKPHYIPLGLIRFES